MPASDGNGAAFIALLLRAETHRRRTLVTLRGRGTTVTSHCRVASGVSSMP